ncbi:hypothetical protein L3Q82_010792 [Scortum barcoo]|uniref:Uncharacterized protein n=1 Tax=Scortum barcoo TaxID=214431 RepID=A0ACB8W8R6_9TELE|nr:hypothetical protein L3Q82_010792 [Scortum barcoo]
MKAFGREDYANSLKDLDLSKEVAPMQRSLGLSWEIGIDTFTFAVLDSNKPFTQRGVLSKSLLFPGWNYVLAVEMAEFILEEIDLKPDTTRFFCDSKVILGYIYNETKRFYVYLQNRVQHIHQFTRPEQWFYIPTERNPADITSRSVQASCLANTIWLTGPAFLHKPDSIHWEEPKSFELVDPDVDREIRPQVKSFATQIKTGSLTADRF